MSVLVIRPGETVFLDPDDIRTVAVDWDAENLASTAAIASSSFAIDVERQIGVTALTKDSAAVLTDVQAQAVLGRTIADSRVTRVRLLATTATEGDAYIVSNTITTDESPAQTKTKSFRVQIESQ